MTDQRLPLPNAYKLAESVAYALMRLPENQRKKFLKDRKWYHFEQALQLTGDSLIACDWTESVHLQTLAVLDILVATRRLAETTRKFMPLSQTEIPSQPEPHEPGGLQALTAN